MQQYPVQGPGGASRGFDLDHVLDNYLTQLQGGMGPGGVPPPPQLLQAMGHDMGGLQAAMLGHPGLMGMGGPPPGQLDPALLARLAGDASQGPPSALNSNVQQSGRGRTRAKPENTRGKLDSHDSDAVSSDGSASSGEQKSRKKREVYNDDDMSAAERRHQALQEKNRRAQRRFRERQKVRGWRREGKVSSRVPCRPLLLACICSSTAPRTSFNIATSQKACSVWLMQQAGGFHP
jgi:hypothetical protein